MKFQCLLRVAFGLYRTPRVGTPCIVVSNHITVLDTYVLSVLFPLQILIYPCFIAGIERVWPRGAKIPLPFNVEILVGKSFFADPKLHRREIARQVEEKVRELAGRYEQARRGEIDFPDRRLVTTRPWTPNE